MNASLPLKRCSCGREYTAEKFAALPCRGWVGCFWSDGKARAVELRQCPCESTIGMECVAPKKIRQANKMLAAA